MPQWFEELEEELQESILFVLSWTDNQEISNAGDVCARIRKTGNYQLAEEVFYVVFGYTTV